MKLIFILLGILKWNQAALSGNQTITTHDYERLKKDLDGHPTKCGVGGTGVDVTRLTAVEGLSDCDCFKCLTVTSHLNGKTETVNVMAVDIGGRGLDISLTAYRKLSGQEKPGLVDVKWTEADPSACQGILPNQGMFSQAELSKKITCRANTTQSNPSIPDQSYNEVKDKNLTSNEVKDNNLPSNKIKEKNLPYNKIKDKNLSYKENQAKAIQISPESQNNQLVDIQYPTGIQRNQPGIIQPPPETQNFQPGTPSNQHNSLYQSNQMNSYNPNQSDLLDNLDQYNPIDNSIYNDYLPKDINTFPNYQQHDPPFEQKKCKQNKSHA